MPARRLRIVSGGQTGVDRAALNVALALGLPCGGWVPRGRRAEDGRIDPRYPVREASSRAYTERTRLNVRDSDATLVLCRDAPTGGTALTLAIARRLRKPFLVVDLSAPTEAAPTEAAPVRAWLDAHAVRTLNVAGPRESTAPGIAQSATALLFHVLRPNAGRPARVRRS